MTIVPPPRQQGNKSTCVCAWLYPPPLSLLVGSFQKNMQRRGPLSWLWRWLGGCAWAVWRPFCLWRHSSGEVIHAPLLVLWPLQCWLCCVACVVVYECPHCELYYMLYLLWIHRNWNRNEKVQGCGQNEDVYRVWGGGALFRIVCRVLCACSMFWVGDLAHRKCSVLAHGSSVLLKPNK